MTARRTASRWVAVAAAGVLGGLVLTVGGLPGQPGGESIPAAAAAGLVGFTDCDALAQWYRPLVSEYVTDRGLVMPGQGGNIRYAKAASGVLLGEAATPAPAAATADQAVGPGATGTNLQEAGVDEPDSVKSAGGRLVTAVGNTLHVLDVSGTTPVRLGSITLPGINPTEYTGDRSFPGWNDQAELLLVGNRVVVLDRGAYQPLRPVAPAKPSTTTITPTGWRTGDGPAVMAPPPIGLPPEPMWPIPTTRVRVVDIADPAHPALVSSEEIEGNLVAARAIAGQVRLVLASTPAPDPAASNTAAKLAALPGQEFLPHLIARDARGEVTQRTPALTCTDVTHPDQGAGPGVLSVRTIDVAAVSAGRSPTVHSTGIAADGDLVYASADRIYAATTAGGWGRAVQTRQAGTVRTQVHGFDISAPGMTRYLVSGSVEGTVLDRWAFSARNGQLRVATTRPWLLAPSEEAQRALGNTNNLAVRGDNVITVLKESTSGLTQVGQVTGLGKGERITAVRWFDDVALVVTFRQTDPLYVVDLRDPTTPTVRGELKVPGFSAYLHPIGEHRILGVGSAATDTGQVTGAQIATFDVSDPAKPTRTAVLTKPDAWPAAAQDARQFTYLPNRRLAITSFYGHSGWTWEAFRVGPSGQFSSAGPLGLTTEGVLTGIARRVIPVGPDRLAMITVGRQGPSLQLVGLDSLATTGSIELR